VAYWKSINLLITFLILLFCVSSSASAQNVTTISQLPQLGTITGSEWFPLSQGTCSTCTYKAAGSQILSYVNSANGVSVYRLNCDGSTDNYAGLSAAIATVPSGGALFISSLSPSSTCILSKALTITSPITLYATPGTVTLKAQGLNISNPVLMYINGASNVTVSGITFDGGGSNLTNTNSVIEVLNSSHVLFTQVTVQNTRGVGIIVVSSSTTGITYSTFSNIGMYWQTSLQSSDRHQAIAYTNSTSQKNYVESNFFTNIGLDSISFTQQTDMVVIGNRCQLALATPQYVTLASAGNWPACIFAQANTSAVIIGNISDSAPGNGVDMGTSDAGLVITGNYIIGSGGGGIALSGTTGFTVTGNYVLNNFQNSSDCHEGGISLSNALSEGVVSSNLATDTQGSKTQLYGVYGMTACSTTTTLTNVQIDTNNQLAGNKTSSFGGSISGPSAISTALGPNGFVTGVFGQSASDVTNGISRITTNPSIYMYNTAQDGMWIDDGTHKWAYAQDGSGNLKLTREAGAGLMIVGNGSGAQLGQALVISSLPTCNSGEAGVRYTVSNGVASPTYQGTVSTTGATTQPVYCNGSSWVYD
jgi:parallel beta-helix repeat protein